MSGSLGSGLLGFFEPIDLFFHYLYRTDKLPGVGRPRHSGRDPDETGQAARATSEEPRLPLLCRAPWLRLPSGVLSGSLKVARGEWDV
jgi:hypothetical protein